MELGNLLFGNSRGPFCFKREWLENKAWENLINTLQMSFYGYLEETYQDSDGKTCTRTNNLVPSDSGGYKCIINNETVFEISPYYWGGCTCGMEDKMAKNFKSDALNFFTPDEYSFLYEQNELECDNDEEDFKCPYSIFADSDDNTLLNFEDLHCPKKQLCKDYFNKSQSLLSQKEKFDDYIDKTYQHSNDCSLVKHNFIYHPGKEDEFWINWYKYPFRDSFCNKELSDKEIENIFNKCTEYTKKNIENSKDVL